MASGRNSSAFMESKVDDDNVFEETASPTAEQRCSLPTSPVIEREHSPNFFGLIKRTFSSKEKKDTKQLLVKYKLRIEELEAELDIKNKQLEEVSRLVRNNRYFVQVGDNNTMTGFDTGLDELKELMEVLTESVDEQIEQRTAADVELKKATQMLAEMQEAFNEYSVKLKNKDQNDTLRFEEMRTMLTCFDPDRSDKQVLTECVDTLKDCTNIQKRFVNGYEDIPKTAQHGIRRLVTKFSKLTWIQLASKLNVTPAKIRGGKSDEKSGHALDRDTCAKVIVEWIKEPDNTASELIAIVELHEKEQSEDMMRCLLENVRTNKVKQQQPPSGEENVRNSMVSERSVTSSETPSGRMCRYQSTLLLNTRSQQAHTVEVLFKLEEICPLLKEMAQKMDEIHKWGAPVSKKSIHIKSQDSSKADFIA